MSAITTHVLDTALGRPVAGIAVTLERVEGGPEAASASDASWREIGRGVTDADGRLRDLVAPGSLAATAYRISFDTAPYFARIGVAASFYPRVQITFLVHDAAQHHHVPLLISPFGYSTYRGS